MSGNLSLTDATNRWCVYSLISDTLTGDFIDDLDSWGGGDLDIDGMSTDTVWLETNGIYYEASSQTKLSK